MNNTMYQDSDTQAQFLKTIRKLSCVHKDQLLVPYQKVKELLSDQYIITTREPEPVPVDFSSILQKVKDHGYIYERINVWLILKKNIQLSSMENDQLRVKAICNYYFQEHRKTVSDYNDVIRFTQEHEKDLKKQGLAIHG